MRVVREYDFIKMVQRGGRSMEESGIRGTQPGGLGLKCPACPHPNINIPDDWESKIDLSVLCSLNCVHLLIQMQKLDIYTIYYD